MVLSYKITRFCPVPLLEDFIQLSEILIKAKNENLDFYAEIEARKTQRTTCRGLKSNLKVLYFSRSYEKVAEYTNISMFLPFISHI